MKVGNKMVWHVKLLNENESYIHIAYSCEEDESLDGIIVYDKNKDDFYIEKLSKNGGEFGAKRTIGKLWGLINTPRLSEKPFRICCG